MRYARHLLRDIPEAELVAACRRDAAAGETFAREHGLAFYADYRDLLDDPRLQAVVLAVPPDRNAEICRRAVDRRLALLIEKPLAHTAAAGREIAAAVNSAGVFAMVAQTLRFNPVVQAFKTHLPVIGPIHALAINQCFEPSEHPWIDAPGPGGIMLNTAVHSFDLLRFLAGREIVRVQCASDRVRTQRTEDLFGALLQLEPGPCLGLVHGSRATGGRSGRIEAVGERGQLVADHVLGFVHFLEARSAHPLPVGPDVPTVRECVAAFVRALARGEPPPISVEDGLRTLEAVEACYQSAASGKAVMLRG